MIRVVDVKDDFCSSSGGGCTWVTMSSGLQVLWGDKLESSDHLLKKQKITIINL